MKNVSADFIANEETVKQKPVELYRIWRGAGDQLNINTWYYTSGDVAVEFPEVAGNTYVPATIQRGLVKYDMQFEITILSINVGYVENPVLEFIAINPIEILWISVMRLHRDQSPLEADVIFVGQLKKISFKGNQASVDCVGFEYFLKKSIPRFRYQINCNWQVFDGRCLLPKITYKVPATITFGATNRILNSATFGGYADGYFTGGLIEHGDESRIAIAHVGNDITLAYPMRGLLTGESVDAYPGCDGRPETCRDKFIITGSNLIHFFGFPFTPVENPAVRTP